MSSAIVWTKTHENDNVEVWSADLPGYEVQIIGRETPGDGLLVPPSSKWSFQVKSKLHGGFSISGHRGHGQSKERAQDVAIAYVGLRSTARVLQLKQVVSDDGWDLKWVADAEL